MATTSLAITVVALAVAGVRPSIDESDSMAPTINAGDVIFSESISAAEAHVGDVITFTNPRVGDGATLTRRVHSVRSLAANRLAFVTGGDANAGSEHWRVPADGTVSRYVFAVPTLGRVIAPIQHRTLGILLVLAGAALSFGLLRRSRRRSRELP